MHPTLSSVFTKTRLILLGLIVLAGGGYFGYRSFTAVKADPSYVTATPEKGLLIVSLPGTGQVAAENRVDIKPKVSGDLLTLKVKAAQVVKKGDVIGEIDKRDALKALRDAGQSVRDAQIGLASAKLSLGRLREPPTGSARLQAENAVNTAKRSLDTLTEGADNLELQQSQNQVKTAELNSAISSDGKTPQIVRNVYDNSVFTLISAVQSTTDGLADADSILAVDRPSANVNFVNLLSVLDQSRKAEAIAAYAVAKASLQDAKAATDALSRQGEDTAKIDAATLKVKDAIEKMTVLLTHVYEALEASLTSSSFTQASLDQLKSTVQGDRTTISSKQQSLLSQDQALTQARTTFTNSGYSLDQARLSLQKLEEGADAKDVAAAKEKVQEAEQNLKELLAGPESIDVTLAQNTVDQRASSLAAAAGKYQDAQDALADYTVVAPFDGIIAVITPQIGDSVGPSTAVATILGKQQVASITLNEVDAAKIKVGQKATLTFDALTDLSVSAQVQSIETLGTVSQGVVSYAVKIGFDTVEETVRPGMSVRAAIITDMASDVLMVPNAAVKAAGNGSYVEVLESASSTDGVPLKGMPKRVTVVTGLSNETSTEIKSGLTGDEHVVVQTIQPVSKTASASTQQTSALRALTGGAGAGGGNAAFRAGGAVQFQGR